MFVVLVVPLATLQYTSSGIVVNMLLLPAAAVMFVFLIPLLSLQIRRLHDIGASGWWVLLGVFLPYIGPMILFCMALLPSQPHPNKYG